METDQKGANNSQNSQESKNGENADEANESPDQPKEKKSKKPKKAVYELPIVKISGYSIPLEGLIEFEVKSLI
jgi:hypothetical protein